MWTNCKILSKGSYIRFAYKPTSEREKSMSVRSAHSAKVGRTAKLKTEEVYSFMKIICEWSETNFSHGNNVL